MAAPDYSNVASKREVFYIPGDYTEISVGDTKQSHMLNQLYVEKHVPTSPTQNRRHALVFIAGAGQTGTNFLETPDGRPGWASFFLAHGYTVFLSDQPSRGRSAWNPSIGRLRSFPTADVEMQFTNTAAHNLWPQSNLHTQWPGSGRAGDPIFDRFFASQVQYQPDRLLSENQNAAAYSKLLDTIGEKVFLVTHSQAGAYGWRIADARPEFCEAIVALEPSGPPFEKCFPFKGQTLPFGITDGPITFSPSAGPDGSSLRSTRRPARDEQSEDCLVQAEPPKELVNLKKIPVLVVTGEASYHAPYDYCTVEFLRQSGVQVEHVELGKEGVKGNGHMLFMEKNNLVIAERVLQWLKKH